MTDFVYDGTALPNGKLDAVPSPGPTDQYVTAAEWNLAMQAMLDIRGSILTGSYHGTATVRWLNASGVTQSRSWWDVANTRLVLAGDASGTTPYMHLTPATGALGLGDFNIDPTALSFSSSVGLSGSDVAMKVGTRLADGSVNAATRLLSIKTGIGTGVEVENAYFSKAGATINTALTVNKTAVLNEAALVMPAVANGAIYGNAGAIAWGGSGALDLIRVTSQAMTLQSYIRPIQLTPYAAETQIGGFYGNTATDVVNKIGSTRSDVTVDPAAKLLSIRTAIGSGSEVEKLAVLKSGQLIGDSGMASSLGSSVLTLNESIMKGARGTAKWSLNEAGGGTAQLYNTSAGVEVLTSTTSLYGRGTLSTDVALKAGTNTSDISVNAAARLLSVKTGIGTGSEVEKFWIDGTGHIRQGAIGQFYRGSSTANGYLRVDDSVGVQFAYINSSITVDSSNIAIIANSGVSLRGGLGATSTDIVTRIGSSAADGTVHSSARLLSIRTGIGTTEVEYAYFSKTIGLTVGSSQVQPGGVGYFPAATYSNLFRPASANSNALLIGSQATMLSSDIAAKIGTAAVDASVDAAAKLLVIGTDLTATAAEKFYFTKSYLGITTDAYPMFIGGLGTKVLQANAPALNVWATQSGSARVSVFGDQGALATDKATMVGTSILDAAIDPSAKLLSICGGLGTGSVTEYVYFTKSGMSLLGTAGFRTSRIHWTNTSDVTQAQSWMDSALGKHVLSGTPDGVTNLLHVTMADGIVRSEYGYQTAQNVAAVGTVTAGDILINPFAYSVSTSVPGGASGDVVLKVGTRLADGAVHAGAKLLSIKTGLGTGGTEVEKAYFDKAGALVCNGLNTQGYNISVGSLGSITPGGGGIGAAHSGHVLNLWGGWAMPDNPTTEVFKFMTSTIFADMSAQILTLRNSNLTSGTPVVSFRTSGRLDQSGTDSSATPGAATINKPTGISAIASGASSVTITNSLVPAVATKRIRIMVYFNGDHGAARDWAVQTTGGGSFVVNLSAGASADTVFSWALAELL